MYNSFKFETTGEFMKSLAELAVFVLGWVAIMALIGLICWGVSRWGKKHQQPEKQQEAEKPNEEQ